MSSSTDVGTVDRMATVSLGQVSKSFGGTRVLKGVDLALRPGEIHGLLGQNGSGKSTLIKILAGFHATDEEGCIRAAGEVLPNPIDPKTLKRMGWAFVHQDLALLRGLSVVDNFQMIGLRSGEGSTIKWGRERRWVNEQLEAFGVDVSASAVVNQLSATQQAMVAVVRAATVMRQERRDHAAEVDGAESAELLILDEPTVYLPERELDELFNLVRRVAAGGASVLFVSHRLPEVRELTEAVTVLRDGRVVASAPTASMSDRQLVTAIVGKDITGEVARSEAVPDLGATLLRIDGASSTQVVNTDLALRAGEILGLAGLAGSGFDELPYLLFGARRAHGGTYTIDSTTARLSSLTPKRAIDLGIALIPGNRLTEGAVEEISMRANVTLTSLKRFTSLGSVQRSKERAAVRDLAERYDIRPRQVEQRFAEFSGGNQQKGLMAKWLELEPRVLIVHEPVQGLDVEARAQVLEQLKDLAVRGAAVVIASSDFRDIVSICQRALIFSQGQPVASLSGDQLTEERMTEASHQNAHYREDAF